MASPTDKETAPADGKKVENPQAPSAKPIEVGGRKGPDPTRYGDWEVGGRCVDF